MHQAGFPETVASLGTAFTANQAMLLRKLGADALLFFDGDTAGEKATEAAIKNCFQAGIACRILRPEGVKDPDDQARTGVDSVNAVVAKSLEPVEFLTRYYIAQEAVPNSATAKSRAVKKVREILSVTGDRIIMGQGLDRISQLLELPRSSLDDLTEIKPKNSLSVQSARQQYEHRILRAALSDRDTIAFIKPYLFPDFFQDEMCKNFTKMLLEYDFELDRIQNCLLDENQTSGLNSFLAKLLVEETPDEGDILLKSLRVELVKFRLEELRRKKIDHLTNEELEEYLNLERMRNKIAKDGREKQG
jgi:DNA primase